MQIPHSDATPWSLWEPLWRAYNQILLRNSAGHRQNGQKSSSAVSAFGSSVEMIQMVMTGTASPCCKQNKTTKTTATLHLETAQGAQKAFGERERQLFPLAALMRQLRQQLQHATSTAGTATTTTAAASTTVTTTTTTITMTGQTNQFTNKITPPTKNLGSWREPLQKILA